MSSSNALRFDTAEEELFYLLDHKPGFDQELLRLADQDRLTGRWFICYPDCGCIYWAYFDCPVDENIVIDSLDAMFDRDLDNDVCNSFGHMSHFDMDAISPIQHVLFGRSSSEINVWLRIKIAAWREARQ